MWGERDYVEELCGLETGGIQLVAQIETQYRKAGFQIQQEAHDDLPFVRA